MRIYNIENMPEYIRFCDYMQYVTVCFSVWMLERVADATIVGVRYCCGAFPLPSGTSRVSVRRRRLAMAEDVPLVGSVQGERMVPDQICEFSFVVFGT